MNYYVTAVRYSTNRAHITHVLVHLLSTSSGRLQKGIIMTKDVVISNILQGDKYQTAIFSYTNGEWKIGAPIGRVTVNNINYLRTDADKTAKDNLNHLLLIDELR